jgi:hypothetical protein
MRRRSRKGTSDPICYWCKESISIDSPYRSTDHMLTPEINSVRLIVCGPNCYKKPEAAHVFAYKRHDHDG